MAWNLAKDRLFGGGFMVSTASVFSLYAPEPDRVHAAHSIYFQVLGEHGFVGLGLFLAMGAATWMTARDLIRMGRRAPHQKWAADLGAMVQVSMIAYATAGAFLSLTYYDLPYNVMIMATVAHRLVRRSTTLPEGARSPFASVQATATEDRASDPRQLPPDQGPKGLRNTFRNGS
jgi:probable O-glycosylation ligase (exosortase A-associated)